MRLPTLPVSLRVPLLAGLAVFVFAVATSRLMLWGMGQMTDREIARLGRVYLDGLAAAVMPAVTGGDGPGLEAALNRALGFQDGSRERQIIVGTPAGEHHASAGLGPESAWPAPFLRGVRGETLEFSADDSAVWVQRPLDEGGLLVACIAAQLDVEALAARRQRFREGMLLFSLALAFNAMVAHVAERERLERQLAGRERAATLGRLAATIAHEVRNPLAGIVTSLEIIRRFGDDRTEGAEAVEVIGRGLEQIERVVSSTPAFHRDHGFRRPLRVADLEDLRVLVASQAEARGVMFDRFVELPRPFPVDAASLRQAILNLLLSAVAASPRGARAVLRAGLDEDECLFVVVEDAGAGMSEASRRRLMGEDPLVGSPEDASPGLGLEVVASIAQRLAARLAVEPGPGGAGTRITLVVPPDRSAEAPCTDPEDIAA